MRGVNYDAWLTEFLDYEDYDDMTPEQIEQLEKEKRDWFDEDWLEENISWKDFGTGVRLGKLKREEKTSLVLYEAQSEVEVDAFMPHSHPGGECYVVLEGEVWDEDGTYPTGSIVWMDPESTHTPKTRGKTLILVLWPQGVKAA